MTGELTDITNTIGVVLFFGVLAGVFADKYSIPKMIPLIFVGIGLSSFRPDFLLNFEDENIKDITLVIAEFGLLFVLFQEGMHLDIRALKKYLAPIALLATVGTILTATLVGIITSLFISARTDIDFNLIFLGTLLIAAISVPTDPAATFSILKTGNRKVKSHLRTILGGESAFNDIVAILLVVIILLPQVEKGETSLDLGPSILFLVLWQFLGGILFGVILAYISLRIILMVQIEFEKSAITLVTVFSIFAIAPILSISSAIAALVAGIEINNPKLVKLNDKFEKQFMYTFWDGVTFLIEIFAFIFIGLLYDGVVFTRFFFQFLGLSLLIMGTRILSVYVSTSPLLRSPKTMTLLSNKDKLFISVAGFKGLTTAVLALLSYVALVHTDRAILENNENIIFADILLYTALMVILLGGIIQGLALPYVSEKMDVYAD
ncbi:MAG: cation:proton antiporter [Candidatus Kariarchaeaceae archaeon]|jgi:CPA1 family monovalent cation:H+ antiporter